MSQLSIRAALEIALNNIAGIIPSVGIVSSNGSSFTTDADHLLQDGLNVKIAAHSTFTGSKMVKVTGARSFSLVDSVTNLAFTVPAGVGGTVTAQLTAWENISIVPLNSVPYQKVNFVFARPEDVTMGGGYYRERAYMQVTLYYPLQKGPGAAMSRAELIRKTFPRGASFSNNGIVVHIDRTSEIMPGAPTDESYIVIVRVPFYADINL